MRKQAFLHLPKYNGAEKPLYCAGLSAPLLYCCLDSKIPGLSLQIKEQQSLFLRAAVFTLQTSARISIRQGVRPTSADLQALTSQELLEMMQYIMV